MAEPPPSANLYVTKLPYDVSEQLVRMIFGPSVTQCKILTPKAPSQGGAALVRFHTLGDATMARETMDGALPPGLQGPICVRYKLELGVDSAKGGYGKGKAWGGDVCGKAWAPDGGKGWVGDGMSLDSGSMLQAGPYGKTGVMNLGPYGDASVMQTAPCGGVAGDANADDTTLYVTGLPPDVETNDVKELFGTYGKIVDCQVLVQQPGYSRHALVCFASNEEAAIVKKGWNPFTLPGCSEPLQVDFVKKSGTGDAFGNGDGGKGDVLGTTQDWQSPWKGSWDKGGSWSGKNGSNGPDAWGKSWGKGGTWSGGFGMDLIINGCKQAGYLPDASAGQGEIAVYVGGLPPDCQEVHLYKLFSPFGSIPPDGVRCMTNPDGTCNGVAFVNYMDYMNVQAACEALHGIQYPDGTTMVVRPKTGGKTGAGKGEGKTRELAPFVMPPVVILPPTAAQMRMR